MDLWREVGDREAEGAEAEVERDGRARVEADDRVERQLLRLRNERRADERAVLGEEDAARAQRESAADDVADAKLGAEERRERSRAVEGAAVVAVVAERLAVPAGLPAVRRKLRRAWARGQRASGVESDLRSCARTLAEARPTATHSGCGTKSSSRAGGSPIVTSK